jgi:hypothetical protein
VLLLAAAPLAAAWNVAQTTHFRLHSQGPADKLAKQARMLEDFHGVLETITGRSVPADMPRLDIYLMPDQARLQLISPGIDSAAVGLYKPTVGGIAAFASRAFDTGDAEMMTGREVLLHEYTHHFMFSAGVPAQPRWYSEGLPEYLMTVRFSPEQIDLGLGNKGRVYDLRTDGWGSVKDLVNQPRGRDYGAVQNFYAHSWMLTHYMNRAPGMAAKLRAYLNRFAAGEDSLTAFRGAVQDDLPALDHTLRSYFYGNGLTFTRVKRTAAEPASVAQSVLPAAADDLLLRMVAIQMPQKARDDARNIAAIRRIAAGLPGDRYAARALAIAEAAGGNPQIAAPLLDTLLAAMPDDAELLRWRADALLATARTPDTLAQARRLLARGFKAAPDDWRLLYAYANTFPLLDGPLPPALLDVLLRAWTLAPQVSGIALHASIALVRAGRRDEAIAALSSVAYAPHGDDDRDDAVALIDALRAKDTVAFDRAVAKWAHPATPAAAPVPPAAG